MPLAGGFDGGSRIAGNNRHGPAGNTEPGTYGDRASAQNRYEIPICKTGYHRYRDITCRSSSSPLATST